MHTEFNFWVSQRMVNVEKHENQYSLARYDVEVDAPRPGTPHLYFFTNTIRRNSDYVTFQLNG